MFRKAAVSYFVILMLILSIFAGTVSASTEYDSLTVSKIMDQTSVNDLKAKASVLMDSVSGNVLLESNSHEKLPIASVTKVMSMLLIMEAIDSGKIKFTDKVRVSSHSYDMGGSQVYLEPGEEFTVKEMLEAVAIHSANDATVAMAEFVAGSEDVFVAAMNEKAKALGMKDSNFLDCTGLTDEGHYSSAYDVAVMSRELIAKHPKIIDFTSTWHATFRNGEFSLDNTNKLIAHYTGTIGIKTGFTTKAGYNLSAAAKKKDMVLITVVLGEPDSNTRFAETRKLLDYGFANYELAQVDKKGAEGSSIVVKKGLKTSVKGIYKDDISLMFKKGDKTKLSREIKMYENVTAPVKVGQKIGDVIYKIDGKEVGKAVLVADAEVEKASFIRLFFRMILSWFGIGK